MGSARADMLKRTYIRLAQAAPGWLAPGGVFSSAARAPHGWRRWAASLGAIYHIDRMIALDIPWWNVAATVEIERFLAARPGASVFEYGSGASTLWLARRAARIVSVEHDAAWAEKLSVRLAGKNHVTLLSAGFDHMGDPALQPYVRAIAPTGQHDLIVVDGRLRTACLDAAIPHLKTDGLLLFDDSGRSRYRAAIGACGLAERRLHGLSYCVPYPDSTSLMTHRRG
ncbi:class I SAM-dependent methyltransferase [Flavisphingomonas formosensis]|uniref:class I SAM-dependent methyltransferase n=1 Tax=Flavisphingomonas formosensis TaxID=861534 RepID=UPI0018E04DDA|nr:class I SAM-dependent methyltransferase [Sphingomonas formosensis]